MLLTKRRTISAVIALAFVSMVISRAFAQAETPQDARSSPGELISQALRNNPEIIALQKSYEAARQRPTQQSSLPEPMVSLGYVSVGNPLPGAGLGSQVTDCRRLRIPARPW